MILNYVSAFRKWNSKNSVKSAKGKLKISIMAIGMGLLLGVLILLALKVDIGSFFSALFEKSVASKGAINQLLVFTSIFALSGMANAFAFKTGLFNIGVSGQMLAGGGVAALMSLTVLKNLDSAIAIPILIIISALVAGIVGILVGFLKTKFNVHEVVSTILLNWILFYLMKYVFPPSGGGKSYMDPSGSGTSLGFPHRFGEGLLTEVGGWPSIVICLSVLTIIFIVLRFTVFGKSLKMTGINQEGSRYAGINVKKAVMASMTISAMIAGILGVVEYFGRLGNMPSFAISVLPSVGFDGIALALLAFNSPIGMIPVALLYAFFKVGASRMSSVIISPDYSNETVSLIFSIIIYFAAIATLFYRFRIFSFIRYCIIAGTDKKVKISISQLKKEAEELKQKIKVRKSVNAKEMTESNELLKQLDSKLKILKLSLKDANKNKQDKASIKKIEQGKQLIETRKKEIIQNQNSNKKALLVLKTELKKVNKEIRIVKNETVAKLIQHKIDLNFSVSKAYVKAYLNKYYQRKYGFEKMALHTKMQEIKSNVHQIAELKREIQDIRKTKAPKGERVKFNQERNQKITEIKAKIDELKKYVDQKLIDKKIKQAKNVYKQNIQTLQKNKAKVLKRLLNDYKDTKKEFKHLNKEEEKEKFARKINSFLQRKVGKAWK